VLRYQTQEVGASGGGVVGGLGGVWDRTGGRWYPIGFLTACSHHHLPVSVVRQPQPVAFSSPCPYDQFAAGAQEYLAAQSKLLQLPAHTSDDEIVQCAAHLQALMAAASAADGVRRLVLLCSGDNNVVGGKVRAGVCVGGGGGGSPGGCCCLGWPFVLCAK
jgi:hypothetical protein